MPKYCRLSSGQNETIIARRCDVARLHSLGFFPITVDLGALRRAHALLRARAPSLGALLNTASDDDGLGQDAVVRQLRRASLKHSRLWVVMARARSVVARPQLATKRWASATHIESPSSIPPSFAAMSSTAQNLSVSLEGVRGGLVGAIVGDDDAPIWQGRLTHRVLNLNIQASRLMFVATDFARVVKDGGL